MTTKLIDLPPVVSLSVAQQRGARCVWCAVAPAGGTAHDLGPHPVDAHGTAAHWFPRRCRRCWSDRGLSEWG
ncbi:hypothetical protein ACGF8B_13895 [Streptomyces sp. NPDC047917]|uniref:hypothetical protein n=1 Tax=Streptomyces sp. NPDC047917 TaxID=3365491 RepID=UPI003716AB41